SFRHLSNFEMLQIQLQKVKDEIEKAYKEKQSRLIFIHGHGSGKLKEELLKVLSRYKGIEVYDASFRKYKLGATEVKLRY
ncbi:MAG: Smr/MutS family protein, partial [Moheibacter sp.]